MKRSHEWMVFVAQCIFVREFANEFFENSYNITPAMMKIRMIFINRWSEVLLWTPTKQFQSTFLFNYFFSNIISEDFSTPARHEQHFGEIDPTTTKQFQSTFLSNYFFSNIMSEDFSTPTHTTLNNIMNNILVKTRLVMAKWMAVPTHHQEQTCWTQGSTLLVYSSINWCWYQDDPSKIHGSSRCWCL